MNGHRRPGILIATPHLPPEIGGVESYVDQLSARLASSHGWRVVIASTTPDPHLTGGPEIELIHLKAQRRVSSTPIGLGWRRAISDALVRYDLDVMNAHTPAPGIADAAARVPGAPLVLTYHVGPIANLNRPVFSLAIQAYEKLMLPKLARRAEHVICSSNYVLDGFASCFAGKSTVVSPGVDSLRFRESRHPLAGRLLFVGSLGLAASYKGLPDLLLAVGMLAAEGLDVNLDVVGDGDGRARYEQLVREFGLVRRVMFRGALYGHALVDAYSAATALVLPTHYDSFPTVLVEAMSCGRPVVSTTVGGIPNLVRHEVDGLLSPPGDFLGLIDNLRFILSDAPRAVEMGREAAAAVRSRLDWDGQAARTHEILLDTIARGSKPRRRVAVVTPYFAPSIGGVERYAEGIARVLAASPDLEPVVYTSGSAKRRTTVEDMDGLRVVQLGRAFRISNTPVSPFWVLQLWHRFRVDGISLIWANSPVPYLADIAVLCAGGRPSVLTYHAGSMVKGTQQLPDALIRTYERYVLPRVARRATRLVAVSSTSLLNSYSNVSRISPSVDVDFFRPNSELGPATPTMTYVGRLERSSSWKGVDVLLRAFALVSTRVPNATLTIVGEGDARDYYEKLAAELGIARQVCFFGALTGDHLRDRFQESSVIVLPSLTEAESFGMALIEGMACGKPVVGSAVGGIPNVIRHGVDGMLVPPGDPVELAQACVTLLTSPDLAERMGRAGRERVCSNFSATAQADAYLAIFRELVSA